jgi:hypothetical protein
MMDKSINPVILSTFDMFRKEQEIGECTIIRSFIIFTVYETLIFVTKSWGGHAEYMG